MTLLPVEMHRVTVISPEFQVPEDNLPRCFAPDCSDYFALERHHIIRRSEFGTVDWIRIDNLVLPNVVYLCQTHHLWITGDLGGHKAWIRYEEGHGWRWFVPIPQDALFATDKLGNKWWSCPAP